MPTIDQLFQAVLNTLANRSDPGAQKRLAQLVRKDCVREVQALCPGCTVKAGTGMGRPAHVPWVAMFPPGVNGSVQTDMFLVYLFAADGGAVYLSLNHGTEKSTAAAVLKRTRTIRRLLGSQPDLLTEITLGSRGERPRKYEAASAYAIRYPSGALPSEEQIKADLDRMLALLRLLPGSAEELDSLDVGGHADVVELNAGSNDAGREKLPHQDAQTLSPRLRPLLTAIQDMNLGTAHGRKVRYKPLMLLAAIRTAVDGLDIAFSTGQLLQYYHEFATAVGEDPSHPEYPYYHLSSEPFWRLVPGDGDPRSFPLTRNRVKLHGTRVELANELSDCILDAEQRPYVLGAVRTYFNDVEWARLVAVWPELARAVPLPAGAASEPGSGAPEPQSDLQAIAESFITALESSNLRFDPAFVRTFVASLATKGFAILTGLSGSGKTQIALQFGRWLGHERVLLVPVRPDWTGPDALFGYEDALLDPRGGRRAWHVPAALEFMLKAARDPDWPYLLILDEMNLAHVERYFADVLSGMESATECLPNLDKEDDGLWRLMPGQPALIPVPRNLFIVGTVNVDETTYMFSPKVLDRANTLEFRVSSDDLADDLRKPVPCPPGPEHLVRGFLALAQDPHWHVEHPHPEKERISGDLRRLHRLLHEWGFEFGHRVFTESLRFAAMLAAAGEPSANAALDAILMQKILPRLHGNRRRLEPVLEAVGAFAFYPERASGAGGGTPRLNLLNPPEVEGAPRLPRSFAKLRRMMANLQANQFTSFAE